PEVTGVWRDVNSVQHALFQAGPAPDRAAGGSLPFGGPRRRAAPGNSGWQASVRCPGAAMETTFVLTGEIDLPTATDTAEALWAWMVENRGADEWVVDCAAVTFIDAAGWRVLHDVVVDVTRAGGRIRLQSPSAVVRRLIVLFGEPEP